MKKKPKKQPSKGAKPSAHKAKAGRRPAKTEELSEDELEDVSGGTGFVGGVNVAVGDVNLTDTNTQTQKVNTYTIKQAWPSKYNG